MDLFGQRILLTGASRGIGFAHAKYLSRLGSRLVLSASPASGEILTQLAKECRAAGAEAHAITAPLESGADELVEAAVACLGGLDAIVHIAGAVQDATVAKMEDSQWQQVLDVNLGSAFRLSRAAWPHFKTQQFGRLVFASSSAGLYGNFGQANYAAAKMGLIGLARTIAEEGRRHGIAANVIAPLAATEMNREILPASVAERLPASAMTPLTAYLCHPKCEVSGEVFEAAGGWISKVHIGRGRGYSAAADELTLEELHHRWNKVSDAEALEYPQSAQDALQKMLGKLNG